MESSQYSGIPQFEEALNVYAWRPEHPSISPNVLTHFELWLSKHNARKGHHWTYRAQCRAGQQEVEVANQSLGLKVQTASDLALITLMLTGFGEFDLPPEFFALADRLVQPSFYCPDDDLSGSVHEHNSALG